MHTLVPGSGRDRAESFSAQVRFRKHCSRYEVSGLRTVAEYLQATKVVGEAVNQMSARLRAFEGTRTPFKTLL